MPVLDGVAATRRITEEFPEVRVVVPEHARRSAEDPSSPRGGAIGYLTKAPRSRTCSITLRRAVAGEEVLSPHLAASMLDAAGSADPAEELLSERQTEILQMIADA